MFCFNGLRYCCRPVLGLIKPCEGHVCGCRDNYLLFAAIALMAVARMPIQTVQSRSVSLSFVLHREVRSDRDACTMVQLMDHGETDDASLDNPCARAISMRTPSTSCRASTWSLRNLPKAVFQKNTSVQLVGLSLLLVFGFFCF